MFEMAKFITEFGVSITVCVALAYTVYVIYKYQREDTQAMKTEYLAREEKLLNTQVQFAESLDKISDTLNLQREELKSLRDEVKEIKQKVKE